MAGIVGRLVPDEGWEPFPPVVPEAPSRPRGGGRRRHGGREVPAAIVFVATSGCTWQQLPSADNLAKYVNDETIPTRRGTHEDIRLEPISAHALSAQFGPLNR
ncbi:hypothetical protein GCM10010275_44640 [Streptomyces litmocidini]|uniref:transposase n=1 Tax=Streptomyces litmocidini TaxID=67318 RepID=UPI0019A4BE6E|nr:hypothetical protein GCM10010275_44640 [Streptomyces litmocidini]